MMALVLDAMRCEAMRQKRAPGVRVVVPSLLLPSMRSHRRQHHETPSLVAWSPDGQSMWAPAGPKSVDGPLAQRRQTR